MVRFVKYPKLNPLRKVFLAVSPKKCVICILNSLPNLHNNFLIINNISQHGLHHGQLDILHTKTSYCLELNEQKAIRRFI